MKKGKLNVLSCYIISAMQGFVELSIVNIVNKLLRFWGFHITTPRRCEFKSRSRQRIFRCRLQCQINMNLVFHISEDGSEIIKLGNQINTEMR